MEEIKVKYFVDGIDELCYVAGKSDWIDLHAAEDVDMKAGEFRLIPLGVAIELPTPTGETTTSGAFPCTPPGMSTSTRTPAFPSSAL